MSCNWVWIMCFSVLMDWKFFGVIFVCGMVKLNLVLMLSIRLIMFIEVRFVLISLVDGVMFVFSEFWLRMFFISLVMCVCNLVLRVCIGEFLFVKGWIGYCMMMGVECWFCNGVIIILGFLVNDDLDCLEFGYFFDY